MKNNPPEIPNPELFTQHLGAIVSHAEQGKLRQHDPQPEPYWKALDLVHVALHLSGVNVWNVNSETGGSSMTFKRSLAEEYLWARGPLTIATAGAYLGTTSYPSTKMLVGLDARLRDYSIPASHFGNEGRDELIATSMRFSDLDLASRSLARRIFELGPEFDTEFVHGHHDSDSTNTAARNL